MANYKLLTHESVGATSELMFTAGGTNTVVSSITAKDGISQTAEVLIQKGGTGTVIEMAEVDLSSNAGFQIIDVAFALEATDKLFIRATRAGMKFIMSYVEETALTNDTALSGLVDVDTTGVSDGDVIAYSSASGEWGPTAAGSGSSGATSLDGLSDVAISTSSTGDFLLHNGTNYVDQNFDSKVASNSIVFGHTTKLALVAVTQNVDLDTMESDIVTNNAKAGYTSTLFSTDFNGKTTADLTEASGSKYYTEARVSANADVTANTAKVSYTDAADVTANTTKLAGIAAGATANDTDANLKNRTNHTGTQTVSTISDFTVQVENVIATAVDSTDDVAEGTTNLYHTNARVDARIGVAKIEDLDEVSSTAPSTGQVLKWSGTEWAPAADNSSSGGAGGVVDSVNGISQATVVLDTDDISDSASTAKYTTAADITKMGHITVTQAVDLDTMETGIATATGMASAAAVAAVGASNDVTNHTTSIENHADVTFAYTGLSRPDGAHLVWDTDHWGEEVSGLDHLVDVDLTTTAPSTNDVLAYDGTNWVAAAPSGGSANVTIDANTTPSSTGDYNDGATIMNLTSVDTAVAAGKPYYLGTNGWTVVSNANATATSNVIALCTSDSTTGSSMLREGVIKVSDTLSGNVGDKVYMHTGSKLTTTEPTSAATVREMGVLLDATNNIIYFKPSDVSLTIA